MRYTSQGCRMAAEYPSKALAMSTHRWVNNGFLKANFMKMAGLPPYVELNMISESEFIVIFRQTEPPALPADFVFLIFTAIHSP
jgi:hypothetical protein